MAQRKIWEKSTSDITVKVYYDPNYSDDARLFANSYADAHGFRVKVGTDRK